MTDSTRPPANDLDSERCILGALFKDESFAVDSRSAGLRPEHFFSPGHANSYAALLDCAESGDTGLVAVKNRLHDRGQLAALGMGATEEEGTRYLVDLLENYSFDWRNFSYHVRCVRDAATLRELDSTGQAMSRAARGASLRDAESLLSEYQERLYALDVRADTAGRITTAADAVEEAIENADAVARGEVSPGLMTGYAATDRATGGFQRGDLITLAASTSAGKTAFALSIASNVAQAGGCALYVSAEMDRRAIANRILQSASGIRGMNLRTGKLHEEEAQAREEAAATIKGWRLAIIDCSCTVGDIAIRARQLAHKWREPLSLIVADYLQLLKPTGGDTRAQEVSGIAWGLKQLAMATGTPILMLSQLNRAGARQDGPPGLHDLKESGDIENHSNAVILLHRPTPAQFDTDGATVVWLRVAKARDGLVTPWPRESGDGIKLRFIPGCTRFEEMTR